jgi:enolase
LARRAASGAAGGGAAAIDRVTAWEALDSRGRPTVACRVHLAGGAFGRAIVPSGASTGRHEAVERRDAGERYGGWGVRGAVDAVQVELGPAVAGLDAVDRAGVDARLEEVDGTPELSRTGANAVLAVSLAAAIAGAQAVGRPLWELLADTVDDPVGSPTPALLPLPMVNVFSGGAHAAGAIDIQDVLVVPLGAGGFAEAMEVVARVRSATAGVLRTRGLGSGLVADEGGLAAPLASNETALALVTEGIEAAGLTAGVDAALAVDLAASQFARPDGGYRLASEGRDLDRDEWLGEVARWCTRYPVVSVEDVLHEDDWDGWTLASRVLPAGCQVLGDDLFATHDERVRTGIERRAANAVLVKPNQAGTLSRAERVLRTAHAAGLATVVSARSGDTEDSWLADLAVGWRAGQIKVGSTMRSERTAKWNRLLELEHDLGVAAVLAGRDVLGGTTT